ncbi:Pantothenate kinase [Spironucleus salmonicida]|uniref:Pantothenate kinase n=1 Tax=Spironucleus salmonicida TaxID=348837 RepID=V6LIX7_9EUKA|nr:Pantothenate kinase [Spironucleus salmonicida]|eukprot:EST44283.1 Pantothenate kinase [Spironucleus salmonicida]
MIRNIILNAFCFLRSLLYTQLKYTPYQSAQTHLKAAQRQLYNRLTKLQLEQCPLIAFDFGTILIKLVIFIPQNITFSINKQFTKFVQNNLGYQSSSIQGSFIFLQFASKDFDNFLHFLNFHNFPLQNDKVMRCTGEQAVYFAQKVILKTKFEQFQNYSIHDCLRNGLKFNCSLKLSEQFYHSILPDQAILENQRQTQWISAQNQDQRVSFLQQITFPALCVDIGSQFTVYKLSLESYEIIAQYPLGGGAFLGISQLLYPNTTYENFQEQISQAIPNNVDLTVGDIYGGNYVSTNLNSNLLAACFGKQIDTFSTENNSDSQDQLIQEIKCSVDYQASLLRMISINIGHISAKHAVIEACKSTFFVGGFLDQKLAMQNLAWAFNVYSGNNAIFVQHGAVLCCLGALFGNQQEYVIDDSDDVVKMVNIISQQTEMKVEIINYELESLQESD